MSTDLPELCALKAGNSTAWHIAFGHLWPIALRAAHHPEACLVPWEAEDVASEAMLDLISRIQTVRTFEEVKALLTTIAYRRAISFSRHKFAAKRCAQEDGDVAVEPSTPVTGLNDLERSELVLTVRKALEILDAQTRLLLMEKVAHEFTYQEISSRHGVPLGTVCTKVSRGLRKMRVHLRESPLVLKELKDYLR